MSARVLSAALPLPLPRPFDYLPPLADDALPVVGARVRVPFGSRELIGVVVATGAIGAAESAPAALKAALATIDRDPLFDGELLESLRWLARYTHAPLGEGLATALPAPAGHGAPLPDTHGGALRLDVR